jgi:starch phosphorylase
MKVLVNGGLNFSELDGWWAEAYAPEVGWAIGDGREHGSDPAWDHQEAEQMYALLENEIIPRFYQRDQAGIPVTWVERVHQSMSRLTPQFSANRVVREYAETHYLARAKGYSERSKNPAAAEGLVGWRKAIEEHWPGLHFGPLDVRSEGGQHVFTAQVYLDGLDPEAVRVELFADAAAGGRPDVVEMKRGDPLVGASNAHHYAAAVPANRPAGDFTVRIVPYHALASIPLECARILWSR